MQRTPGRGGATDPSREIGEGIQGKGRCSSGRALHHIAHNQEQGAEQRLRARQQAGKTLLLPEA